MISNAEQAFVWIWLPHASEPVLAGQIVKRGTLYSFTYSRRYRDNPHAIALSPFELPLTAGTFTPTGLNTLHSCLRDAAPDAWGRRVINHHHPKFVPDELDYLLLSGSERIGALDFQLSATHYEPRQSTQANLKNLLEAAVLVEKHVPLPPELETALLHGTSVGGARPKALIQDDTHHYIAKFSSSADYYEIVKSEFVAMQLARKVGLKVAQTHLVSALGKDVLLVERFDRTVEKNNTERHLLLSGLSLLGLNEMEARYASYKTLADLIRNQFADPFQDLKELFQRLVFNILIGNTDDHARNHAAFWDGTSLRLTPAYDLCPQLRSGYEASQAMQLEGVQGNLSTLVNALSICETFLLTNDQAIDIINYQVETIEKYWESACDQAGLALIERKRLWGSAVFNPFCFNGFKD